MLQKNNKQTKNKKQTNKQKRLLFEKTKAGLVQKKKFWKSKKCHVITFQISTKICLLRPKFVYTIKISCYINFVQAMKTFRIVYFFSVLNRIWIYGFKISWINKVATNYKNIQKRFLILSWPEICSCYNKNS